MRFKRPVVIASIAAMTLILSNFTQGSVSRTDFSESYPPVVCPATPSGETSAVSLPSTQTGVRVLGKRTNRHQYGKSREASGLEQPSALHLQFHNGLSVVMQMSAARASSCSSIAV